MEITSQNIDCHVILSNTVKTLQLPYRQLIEMTFTIKTTHRHNLYNIDNSQT